MVKSGSGGSSHTPLFNDNNKMVITREINKSKLPSPSLIHLLGIYFKGVSFHFLGPHHTLGGRLHLHAGWLVGVRGTRFRWDTHSVTLLLEFDTCWRFSHQPHVMMMAHSDWDL